MTTTTLAGKTGFTTRWIAQAAFAFILVGGLAATTLTGAGAAPESQSELEAGNCQYSGGQWIEMTDDAGNVVSTHCVYDDGASWDCDAEGFGCVYTGVPTVDKGGSVNPTTPAKPTENLEPEAAPVQVLSTEPAAKPVSGGVLQMGEPAKRAP
jgi:hypothetical protein